MTDDGPKQVSRAEEPKAEAKAEPKGQSPGAQGGASETSGILPPTHWTSHVCRRAAAGTTNRLGMN